MSETLVDAARTLSGTSKLKMNCVARKENWKSIFHSIPSHDLDAVKVSFGIVKNRVKQDIFHKFVKEQGECFDRQLGCYFGMVLGDALGAPIEFLPAQNTSNSIEIDNITGEVRYPGETYNVFQLERGQWTDDASMGACIADSLIVHSFCEQMDADPSAPGADVWSPCYSGADIRSRFWNWSRNSYNNAFRYYKSEQSLLAKWDNSNVLFQDPKPAEGPFRPSVGLGGNISTSLKSLNGIEHIEDVPDWYLSGTDDSGNGGIMRLASISVFFSSEDTSEYTSDTNLGATAVSPGLCQCMKYARLSSQTTHPGVLASQAAEFLSFACTRAISRPADDMLTASEFIEMIADDFIELQCTVPPAASAEGGDGTTIPGIRPNYGDMVRLLRGQEGPESTELCWNWRHPQLDIEECNRIRGWSYNGHPNNAGYFGSFCMDGLAVALNCFKHSESTISCLQMCINYRGDCDSTAAVAGQLAGSFYGVCAVPPQLLERSLRWDHAENLLRAVMLTPRYRRLAKPFLMDCQFSYQHERSISESSEQEVYKEFTTAYPEYPPTLPHDAAAGMRQISLNEAGGKPSKGGLSALMSLLWGSKS